MINVVEDILWMDLDCDVVVMLVVGFDECGCVVIEDVVVMVVVFVENGVIDVFLIDDLDEGEVFIVVWWFVILVVESKGVLLFEDVGVLLFVLGELVIGIVCIVEEWNLMILVIVYVGDGNIYLLLVYDFVDVVMLECVYFVYGEIMDLVVGLGGMIIGEYGVGWLKWLWLVGYFGFDVLVFN